MTTPSIEDVSLGPSELGTKEYWDDFYERELTNHTNDNDDEGTNWFEEYAAEIHVNERLESFVEQELLCKDGPDASRILDLGTGNGHMLFMLRQPEEEDEMKTPWKGEMIGVDYSAASINLAKQIATQRQIEPTVRFEVWDLLHETPSDWLKDGFDLVLDKGTFDAISLMPQQADAAHTCDVYFKRVAGLVRPGGLLAVTSCNWTKAELLTWLARSSKETRLEYFDEALYQTFSYGGVTGSSIISLIFRRAAS